MAYRKCSKCEMNYVQDDEGICAVCKDKANPERARGSNSNRISIEQFCAGKNSVMCGLAKRLLKEVEANYSDVAVYAIEQYIAITKNGKMFMNIEVNQDTVRVNLPSFNPSLPIESTIQIETRKSTEEKAFSIYSVSDIPSAMSIIRAAYNLK